jgi:protein involved in polysaccharide export with SLBB domain
MLAVAGLSSASAPVDAQATAPPSPARANLTRAELETMLERLTETALSASAGPVREQARTESGLIRSRLAAGDLRSGDQIVLVVMGQPQLTDTFTVSPGRTVVLPGPGEIAVEGVLRSELADHLARQIARVVPEPRVDAHVLIPIDIGGAVQRPGRYEIPAELPAADALSLAGGPTLTGGDARARIRRGGDVIWEGLALRTAELMGLSLDQLSLAGGDRIEVPGGDSLWNMQLAKRAVAVGAVASFLAVLVQAGIF